LARVSNAAERATRRGKRSRIAEKRGARDGMRKMRKAGLGRCSRGMRKVLRRVFKAE